MPKPRTSEETRILAYFETRPLETAQMVGRLVADILRARAKSAPPRQSLEPKRHPSPRVKPNASGQEARGSVEAVLGESASKA